MRKKRSRWALLTGLLSGVGLLTLTYFMPPDQPLSLGFIRISLLAPSGVLLFTFVAGIMLFLLRSRIHAVLAGLFVVSFCLLRINNFTHPLFITLLIAFFLLLEVLFYYSKKP